MSGNFKTVSLAIPGEMTSDGDGVRLKRILGSSQLNMFDPFLLLDEFKNEDPTDYIGGFPPHPHRGFETVTYMMAGNFSHEDSRGNKGFLRSGSVQWMSAGKGIIHSEMPAQDKGLVWGFQLWINLPAKYKGNEPKYQDIDAEKIPIVDTTPGVRAKVISGTFNGVRGPGKSYYPFTYLDLTLDANANLTLQVPEDENSMVYVYESDIFLGTEEKSTKIPADHLAILSEGTEVRIKAGNHPAKMLFFSAQRINEPVARGGPFVMNTKEEIYQAFKDYQNGRLG